MDTAPGRQRHILVVDDDRLVFAALAEGLRTAGYRVTGAASGEDALDIAGRDAPDLALLDMRMPGMSGIEAGRRLRYRPFSPDGADGCDAHGRIGDEARDREAV